VLVFGAGFGCTEVMNPVNLDEVVATLMTTAQSASSGRAARMVAGGRATVMTQTVIALTAGSRLDDHENPGEATVFVMDGEIEVGVEDQTLTGATGDLIIVPDVRHHLTAAVDSIILFTAVKLNDEP